MPGDMVPGQMYDHELNVLKGWWHMHALDKVAAVAEGEVIPAGGVCYLDANGEFRSGQPENVLACLAWPNSTDFDVSADVGNIQEKNLMALPVTGPYEVQTTEFDASETYAYNDYLTAWDSQLAGYVAANKGKVRPGTPYENTILGIVSAPAVANEHGVEWLSFWTYHLPIDIAGS